MVESHVALITVSLGADKVVMPSKTYSALLAGQAILAIAPPDSDLADLVRQHGCGWVVAPGDVAGLRAVLENIAADHADVQAKRERAFVAGHRYYDMKPITAQWEELIGKLGKRKAEG